MNLEHLIKIELARQKLRQFDLATRLDLKLSTFSSYLRGTVSPPPRFRERCEQALQLPAGALRPSRHSAEAK